ncbi:predicted protein [Nematostella vectensis]|uniref:Sulfotransferase family protein n=1 Tax=Nematostella vectensis TaxID=45351 RepID=A7RIT4_NEMVE|nr:branched-chain-amino-acid aminotransferase-like protein 2 [Nematostella vectensis]EDO48455.1 predicted protein [Nematostella vectensis]|eukprot:XP_001640518.1 predicted protein [Nematostella vectensis]
MKQIILWSHPRSVSTAFERCIRTLRNGQVFHEPFAVPFYFGPDKQTDDYLRERPDYVPEATYQSVAEEISARFPGKEFVFVKEMAVSTQNHFEVFLQDEMKDFQHTFLVRNPEKSLRSLYRTGYFDPGLAGIKELYDMYEFVKNHLDPSPLVIDSDDLLHFPDEVMRMFCAAVGIGYQENMMRWTPGPVEGWDRPLCQGWHDDVMVSSGLRRRTEFNSKSVVGVLPQKVLDAIKENMSYYEAISRHRTSPDSKTL